MTLSKQVGQMWLEARDTLRMSAISNEMLLMRSNERSIAKTEEDIELLKLNLAKAKYDLNQLDQNDPEFTVKKEQAEQELTKMKNTNDILIKDHKKTIEKCNSKIVKNRESIVKLESGETKMSWNRIHSIVSHKIGN